MRKETNLEGVKSIAKQLVMVDLCLTEYSPVVVQHPFTSSGKLSQSTIRRALHDLRKEGLLITEQRYRKTGGKSSLLYRLKAE